MHPHESNTTTIRAATAQDVEPIVEIERDSFAHPGERFAPRRVRYLVGHSRFLVLVAEQHGNVVGWVAGFTHLRGKAPWGRVYAIAVNPRVRGQQLGRRLMEQIVDALVRRGARQIFLEVRADNHAAQRLYHKLGFAQCRELPNYYGHGIAAARMVRVTAPSNAASS